MEKGLFRLKKDNKDEWRWDTPRIILAIIALAPLVVIFVLVLT